MLDKSKLIGLVFLLVAIDKHILKNKNCFKKIITSVWKCRRLWVFPILELALCFPEINLLWGGVWTMCKKTHTSLLLKKKSTGCPNSEFNVYT